MAFPPLGNSDHVVVSVSIDFPTNSQQIAPFHRIAYDYSENLKLRNISVTSKMVRKVVMNLDLSKASGPDCIPVVVLT